ncbi:endonuclease/exonuclease/phosphatase family protein [Alkaliphilus pronyensis]|uniref:Endonuclease/exonuclease/phosphatase family protein n=1 Tax=Alkaliphilus pronyensis TaxID=1482732 RepID=A0A6I0FCF4_9FIRM|nr:endonuclease/exonuclease/phosphatase family protein [Alkaliphilus pronyensis]KAB3536256.1 endonuclease/exonuclease/phosphatase family protein [Alkaliphilus pronyensis]
MNQKYLSILQTSLNLRIEKGQKNKDYSLDGSIASVQLNYEPDVLVNLEDMEECDRAGYDGILSAASYKRIAATDDRQKRGVSCWVKDVYSVEKIFSMTNPHFLHVMISNEDMRINLLIIRILISSSTDADFKDRYAQWMRVMQYVDNLKDKSNIVLAGDFNHGYFEVSERYYRKARRFYNYHIVSEDLKSRNLPIVPIEGYSKDGFLKIDHIATSSNVKVIDAKYDDPFDHLGTQRERSKYIGIPDHSVIFSKLNLCKY